MNYFVFCFFYYYLYHLCIDTSLLKLLSNRCMWCNYLWYKQMIHLLCSCFRATVIENEVWHKDDGALTKLLCAEQADDSNTENIRFPDDSSKADCCACGTAKYQLTFHSLWSQNIHSHDSRDADRSLRWSPVVGSSHSKHYVMWNFNTLASQGVSDICQFGDTRALEDEIRHQVNCSFALVPYILAYKSQNLPQNLAPKVRGRLIRGS